MSKQKRYLELVEGRKACRACEGLLNPSVYEGGRYDSNHIGPWSRWQANLNARLLVIGQDWGDKRYFVDHRGFDGLENPTNRHLKALLESVGVAIQPPPNTESVGEIFLTNAILCLKRGGLQAPVRTEWFENCGKKYLQPLIDLVDPEIVITLGLRALTTVLNLYGIPRPKCLRDAVENRDDIELPGGTLLFPMYHCGQRVLNTHRSFTQQMEDWARVRHLLEER